MADRNLGGIDVAAKAGSLLAAWAVGKTYQPNLLSRSTIDQAILTGTAAAGAYGVGTTVHSIARSLAARITGQQPGDESESYAAAVVAGSLMAAGAAGAAALPWREHEGGRRALARLVAGTVGAAGAAGLGAEVMQRKLPVGARTLVAAVAVGGLSYLATRPWRVRVGADQDGVMFEDSTRTVKPVQGMAIGAVTAGALFGLAHMESALSTASANVAAAITGADPEDHRTFGRLAATAITFVAGYYAVTLVSDKLTKSGIEVEPAHAKPPTSDLVTGGPGSTVNWSVQSRESRRWLTMTLTPQEIEAVIGEPAIQPIRVYSSLECADTEEARAEALLAEIDRTGALQRKHFALFSPTGSGYVNYVACETFEYLTRGDCASACIEYSVLPSALSLTRVGIGVRQSKMVLDGITSRLLAMPEDKRPIIHLFGESLGSAVASDMFAGTGTGGFAARGIDSTVLIGTPAFSEWKHQMQDDSSITQTPQPDAEGILITRNIPDWTERDAEVRSQVRHLLLQNGDDPVPKFESPLAWRKPAWLGPDPTRPTGSPKGTTWIPGTTFLATFLDLMNALTPTPGRFDEGGHDYRIEVPEAVATVWRLPVTDDEMTRVQAALRRRELSWEVARRWTAASLIADPASQEAARAKVLADVAQWTGEPQTPETIEALLPAQVAAQFGQAVTA